jgi:hypothetical protein
MLSDTFGTTDILSAVTIDLFVADTLNASTHLPITAMGFSLRATHETKAELCAIVTSADDTVVHPPQIIGYTKAHEYNAFGQTIPIEEDSVIGVATYDFSRVTDLVNTIAEQVEQDLGDRDEDPLFELFATSSNFLEEMLEIIQQCEEEAEEVGIELYEAVLGLKFIFPPGWQPENPSISVIPVADITSSYQEGFPVPPLKLRGSVTEADMVLIHCRGHHHGIPTDRIVPVWAFVNEVTDTAISVHVPGGIPLVTPTGFCEDIEIKPRHVHAIMPADQAQAFGLGHDHH